jgi:GR25 family glycosyltransferase involved in LPS biosynthesis
MQKPVRPTSSPASPSAQTRSAIDGAGVTTIPVVVISLVRSSDRRAAMTAQLEAMGLPFIYFDAIDGNLMTAEQATFSCRRPNPRRYGAYLSPSELGCTASFRMVCQGIAQGEDEFVCVLEDDVTLDPKARILLDRSVLRAAPRFDILRIQHTSERWLPVALHSPFTFRAPFRPTYGTRAQIFTRAGAAKVAAGLADPWMPIDMTVFSDGIVGDLRILEIDPPLAFHPSAQQDRSTIDPDGIRPGRAGFSASASIVRRARRALYEQASRTRVFRNFVRQWGWQALARLRS